MAPGNQEAYVMTVDVFAFPVNNKPDQKVAQDKLAMLMMDPEVQVEFNKFKGSIPSRLDAEVGELDACAQLGKKVMAGVKRTSCRISRWRSAPTPRGRSKICWVITGASRR